MDVDNKLIRAEACATVAAELRDKGFVPDLICAHPGCETLFLRDVWPAAPLLSYQEFFTTPMVLTMTSMLNCRATSIGSLVLACA